MLRMHRPKAIRAFYTDSASERTNGDCGVRQAPARVWCITGRPADSVGGFRHCCQLGRAKPAATVARGRGEFCPEAALQLAGSLEQIDPMLRIQESSFWRRSRSFLRPSRLRRSMTQNRTGRTTSSSFVGIGVCCDRRPTVRYGRTSTLRASLLSSSSAGKRSTSFRAPPKKLFATFES